MTNERLTRYCNYHNPNSPILQLRIALTTSDYDRLVKFYCEGLRIEPTAEWKDNGGQALMLEMGQATLEIFDEAQAEAIDHIEAGKRVSGRVRFALLMNTFIPFNGEANER